MPKLLIKKVDTDIYFDNVSLLLPFDSNFNDNSKNKFSITPYGNTQISSTQSKFGGSSTYFDGDGDYLVLEDNDAFNFNSGFDNNPSIPFTIEAWIYPLTLSSETASVLISKDTYGSNFSWCIALYSDRIGVYTHNINGDWQFEAAATILTNTWQHVTLSMDGTTQRLFLNGALIGTKNAPITNVSSRITIGCFAWNNPDAFYNGYIDDLRITKGIARYISNFTPPEKLGSARPGKLNIKKVIGGFLQNGKLRIKTPLPFPIANLFAFWNLNESSGTRYDSSGNGRNLTETYGTVSSTTGKIANCAYFNGTGGGGSTNSKLGSTSFGVNPNSNFSMSVWMKPRSFSGSQHIIGAPFQNGFYIGGNNSNLTFNLYNGTVWGISAPSTTLDTWHHYVFIREGDTLKLYADNVYIGSADITGESFDNGSVFSVGGGEYNEYYFNGDIDALGLWTRPLTESEIASLYNGGNGSEI
jgi:hypothetical protein